MYILAMFEVYYKTWIFEGMDKKEFYTTEEVAELLNSNVQTVRNLIKTKQLKAYFKLRKYYVLHSDLVNYIKR